MTVRALRFTWRDCLFVHWPVDTAPLENAIPGSLPLDTYDGQAWVSVLASTIENARPPGTPRAFGMTFPQVNFRTYVRLGDATGVYFLSLDTASRVATRVARRLYHLPYFHADITVETDGTSVSGETGNATETGESRRVRSHRHRPETLPVEFEATYRPGPTASVPESGSLADFLAERYRLFVPQAGMTARVEHDPWALYPAEADVRAGSLFDAVGLPTPDAEPRVRYCPEMEFHVHAPKRLG